MTTIKGRAGPSRRTILKAAGASLIVAAITPAGVILGRDNAWAATAEALKPESFATLVQMSRDTYPHARLEDKFYAAAVSALDGAAKADEAVKAMLEDGVAQLDAAASSGGYSGIAGEEERMALLESIEATPFFQKVRGNLVTGLYNNKEAWPLFGYEGESASKGGYINRGFDDIGWL